MSVILAVARSHIWKTPLCTCERMTVERKGGNNNKNLSIIMKKALTLQSPKNNLEGGPQPTPRESIALTVWEFTLPHFQQLLYMLSSRLNSPIGHPPFLHLSCFLLHKENTTVRKLHQEPTTEATTCKLCTLTLLVL